MNNKFYVASGGLKPKPEPQKKPLKFKKMLEDILNYIEIMVGYELPKEHEKHALKVALDNYETLYGREKIIKAIDNLEELAEVIKAKLAQEV
tara:strand:- start:220 stop:495 length:276 start_codon:yes stop_codon:yes gene_type:complete